MPGSRENLGELTDAGMATGRTGPVDGRDTKGRGQSVWKGWEETADAVLGYGRPGRQNG